MIRRRRRRRNSSDAYWDLGLVVFGVAVVLYWLNARKNAAPPSSGGGGVLPGDQSLSLGDGSYTLNGLAGLTQLGRPVGASWAGGPMVQDEGILSKWRD